MVLQKHAWNKIGRQNGKWTGLVNDGQEKFVENYKETMRQTGEALAEAPWITDLVDGWYSEL